MLPCLACAHLETPPGLGGRNSPATAFCLLVLCLASTVPARAQRAIIVSGKVRTEAGVPIPPGVSVWLETADRSPVDQRIANSEGQFEFSGLSKALYRLKVTAPGFNPLEQDLDLTYVVEHAFVNIYLTPATKTRPSPASLPALSDQPAPKKARKEYEQGSKALQEKDLVNARAHFETAVEQYPCYARAQTELAYILVLQHDAARAEAALKKSIQCDNGYLEAYARYAIILNTEKRFGESEAILQEGLRRSPNDWEFHYQLGASYAGREQYAKAEEEYLKAQSLNPSLPAEVHVKLADVYQKMGAHDKAYAEMQAYLLAEPGGRFAARIRTIMQRMESSGTVKSVQPAQPRP